MVTTPAATAAASANDDDAAVADVITYDDTSCQRKHG
jgi:hypothetical protein